MFRRVYATFFSSTLEKWCISAVSLCSPFVYRASSWISIHRWNLSRVYSRERHRLEKFSASRLVKDTSLSHLSTLSSSSSNTRSMRISFADPYGSAERPFSGWRNRLPFLRHWSLARNRDLSRIEYYEPSNRLRDHDRTSFRIDHSTCVFVYMYNFQTYALEFNEYSGIRRVTSHFQSYLAM